MTTGSSAIDLSDIVEIQQLLARYGHAIDDRDWTAFRALFLTDAVLDYTAVRAPEVCNGIDSITSPRASQALLKGRIKEREAFGLSYGSFVLAALFGTALIAVRIMRISSH